MKNDWGRLAYLMLRLEKLVSACHSISKNLGLSDALYKIVEEVCDSLECDRASVFMLDELNGQLWTKAAKGAETIRIPMTQGIVGHVVQTGEIMNIEDAYQTKIFNKKVDKLNNYRTKSILCCPIKD
jgi:signal transduction protein with GAF and PtsI domain